MLKFGPFCIFAQICLIDNKIFLYILLCWFSLHFREITYAKTLSFLVAFFAILLLREKKPFVSPTFLSYPYPKFQVRKSKTQKQDFVTNYKEFQDFDIIWIKILSRPTTLISGNINHGPLKLVTISTKAAEHYM